ncbi:MAG: YwiC-like family protein [Armatimonadota bacterium]|nr:YwiC-like family protein [bacterium]MDW8321112.1 YwiC-like family protein [Armatimonadota bacterium]
MRAPQRIVLPHEHGAWMMWLVPLAVGLAITPWHLSKPLLVGAVLFAYLASYPLLQALRYPGQRTYWLRWAAGYGVVAAALGIPLVLMRPSLLVVGFAALMGFAVNAWFARLRNERNLFNDLVAMAGLNLTVVAAYIAGAGVWSDRAWILWGVCMSYFFGSALHVKSLIRERRNRWMKVWAVVYMLAVPVALAWLLQPLLAVAYLPAIARTLAIPQSHSLRAIALGVIEIVCSVWFAVWLIVLY